MNWSEEDRKQAQALVEHFTKASANLNGAEVIAVFKAFAWFNTRIADQIEAALARPHREGVEP